MSRMRTQRTFLLLCWCLMACWALTSTGRVQAEAPRLKVSDNGRFLVQEDGRPFFYLGDTAWELFHRRDREEAVHYLDDRAGKGFTVIQAVVLAELDGLNTPNPYGHTPLKDNDPARPDEDYFKHVDFIVDQAAERGLFIGMLPTWGDKFNKKWGQGPEIFTPENARAYGRFLGERYKEKPILWILGGDRPIEDDLHEAITHAMAEGIRAGDEGRHLMTYHPSGGRTSATWFHEADWLDFNMLQSGHGRRDLPNHEMITRDYNREPVKPCIDGEPRYENHPINWKPEEGWFDEYDVRKAAYWALFAGAFGHTYGSHDIWQMYQPGRSPISSARTPWKESLKLPASAQMRHARRLLESRPFLSRIPDQSLIVGGQGEGGDHVQATRSDDESYALIYISSRKSIVIDLGKLGGESLNAWWFDPRDGSARKLDTFRREGRREFQPPYGGPDWVLVLDDASRDFPAPGQGQGGAP
ncbi:glycoside hydrolase family 140 protein [soil metagenome]